MNDFASLIAREYASEVKTKHKVHDLKGARKILKDAAYVSGIVYNGLEKLLKEEMGDSEFNNLFCYQAVPLSFMTTGGI